MDIDIINTLLYDDKEYSIIDMKIIRALDKKNPFLLEHYSIQRGEILIGDYVRSIKAVWSIVGKELLLKELFYKQGALTIFPAEAHVGNCKTTMSGGIAMETMTIMDSFAFTGRLRLARDDAKGHFVDSNDNPLTFQTVVDITLHNDQLVGVIDRSRDVEELRDAMAKGVERIVKLIDL